MKKNNVNIHPNVKLAAQTVQQLRSWGFTSPLENALLATILRRQQDTATVLSLLVKQLHARQELATMFRSGGTKSILHEGRVFMQSPDFCMFYHRVRGCEYNGSLDYQWIDARILGTVKGTQKKM